jgi:hypothetical protein
MSQYRGLTFKRGQETETNLQAFLMWNLDEGADITVNAGQETPWVLL